MSSSEDFSLARRNRSNWDRSCSEVTRGCCKRAFRIASGAAKYTARFIGHNIRLAGTKVNEADGIGKEDLALGPADKTLLPAPSEDNPVP